MKFRLSIFAAISSMVVIVICFVLIFTVPTVGDRIQRLESKINNLQSQVLKLHAESAANKFVIQALHPDDVKFSDPE
jgi:uncharacterized protein YoxC